MNSSGLRCCGPGQRPVCDGPGVEVLAEWGHCPGRRGHDLLHASPTTTVVKASRNTEKVAERDADVTADGGGSADHRCKALCIPESSRNGAAVHLRGTSLKPPVAPIPRSERRETCQYQFDSSVRMLASRVGDKVSLSKRRRTAARVERRERLSQSWRRSAGGSRCTVNCHSRTAAARRRHTSRNRRVRSSSQSAVKPSQNAPTSRSR
jgi:hypothetical protein